MLEEMERALDTTDQFLDIVLQDKNRLKDPNFMMYLMSVRQKHKKTFAIIDELYDLSFSAKSTESFKDFQTDIIDQQHYDENDVWIVDDERKRSRSMQSLVQTQNHKWCDERRFDYADQRSPQITGSISNIKKSQIRNNTKSIRASYSQRFMHELMEKKKNEEIEEKKKIAFLRNKARNVPQSTYEPRYQQLCEKEQQARKMRHQKAVEMLKKVRSPRMVAKFESENFHLRRCISAEAFDWKKRETFKAKDVPLSVYVPPYKDEIEACKRARRKTERVAELIRTSRAPPGLEKHAIQSKVQHRLRHAKYCTDQEPKRNICYSRTVPNFKKLHEKLLNKLEKAAENRPVTVVTPFYFQTDEQTHHKCKHENLLPEIHRRSYSMSNLREYNGPGIRLNHASLLRNEANRIRVQKMEIERNCSKKFWELMRKRGELARIKLKQKMSTEVTTICDIQRRLEEKKTKQQERADEYRNELEAMKRRVQSRALIIEQQEMLIKMQRFERKYNETVAGIRNKTRKISIKNQYSKRLKGKMMMINSDQQTMMISALDQSDNEMQTSKMHTNGNNLFISDSEDKEKEAEYINEDYDNDDNDNDSDCNDIDYDDDDFGGDNDSDDDDNDDDENDDDPDDDKESESENDDFDEAFTFKSKNSESSSES